MARRQTSLGAGPILLAVIALILYASLSPWNFHARHLPANPLWILLTSWPGGVNRFVVRDVAVNLIGYVPLGLFGFLTFARRRGSTGAAAGTLLLALLISTSIELLQLFDRGRTTSSLDVLCNVLGAAGGVALARMHGPLLARTFSRPDLRAALHLSPQLVLLLLWVGYLAFPPIPALSRTQLGHKLAALAHGASFSAPEALACTVDWLVVARLLESVAGPGGVRTPLIALMFLVPAKLLISGRTMTWSELAGAVAAFLIWQALLFRYPKRTALLAWASAGALVLRGLAPFHFLAAPHSFTWVPFGATLASDSDSGLVVLFRKSFLYGAAVWLFGGPRSRYPAAAAGIALLLAVLEAAQAYLPGRSAEITDPLLAVLMALLLARLERTGRMPERRPTA